MKSDEIIQGQIWGIDHVGIITDYTRMGIFPKDEQTIVTLLGPDDVKKKFYMLTEDVIFKQYDFVRSVVSKPAYWHAFTCQINSAGSLSCPQIVTSESLVRYSAGDDVFGEVRSRYDWVDIADRPVSVLKMVTHENKMVFIVDNLNLGEKVPNGSLVHCVCDNANDRYLSVPTCQSITVSHMTRLPSDDYYKMAGEKPLRRPSSGRTRKVVYSKTSEPG